MSVDRGLPFSRGVESSMRGRSEFVRHHSPPPVRQAPRTEIRAMPRQPCRPRNGQVVVAFSRLGGWSTSLSHTAVGAQGAVHVPREFGGAYGAGLTPTRHGAV